MTDFQSLQQLRERLSKLEFPDREVDAEIGLAVGAVESWRWSEPDRVTGEREPFGLRPSDIGANWEVQVSIPRLTASIDAALALVERALPGWRPDMGWDWEHNCWEVKLFADAETWWRPENYPGERFALECGRTLPQTILLALLDALISEKAKAEEPA